MNLGRTIPPKMLLASLLGLFATTTPAASKPAASPPPDAGTITISAQRIVPRLEAFARVTPMSQARLLAGLDGRLLMLAVRPGDTVHRGQIVGRLGGSQTDALLANDRSAVQAARAGEHAADDTLAALKQRLAQHLATRQQVDIAAAAAARARAARQQARQQLQADMELARVRAPADGAILELRAHAGERVRAGQTLAVMQPTRALWLLAPLYGTDARQRVHVGMEGRFVPDDGSAPVRVHVVQRVPRLQPDGGLPIALLPLHTSNAPPWINGETGVVKLDGKPRKRILVPTRALILDQGRWWVLLVTSHGDVKHAVIPGHAVGRQTEILNGLSNGDRVVVDQAYLRFHREITRHYQVQD